MIDLALATVVHYGLSSLWVFTTWYDISSGSRTDELNYWVMSQISIDYGNIQKHHKKSSSNLQCWHQVAKRGRRGEKVTENISVQSVVEVLDGCIIVPSFYEKQSFRYSSRTRRLLCESGSSIINIAVTIICSSSNFTKVSTRIIAATTTTSKLRQKQLLRDKEGRFSCHDNE